MEVDRQLTAKGSRTAERVLKAATAVLARDGYGGATLGRIADEANVDKRAVLYYFGTRETLLVRVVQTVGERVAEHIDRVAAPPGNPDELAAMLVGAIWSGVTSSPELARAYFALVGGGAGSDDIEQALEELKSAYAGVIERRLSAIAHTDWRLRGEMDDMVTLTLAVFRGLLLEWTETGDTSRVAASLTRLRHTVAAQFEREGAADCSS